MNAERREILRSYPCWDSLSKQATTSSIHVLRNFYYYYKDKTQLRNNFGRTGSRGEELGEDMPGNT
jgi:hypothetical protein